MSERGLMTGFFVVVLMLLTVQYILGGWPVVLGTLLGSAIVPVLIWVFRDRLL